MKFEKLQKFEDATLKRADKIRGGALPDGGGTADACTDRETEFWRMSSSHEAVDGTGIGAGTAAGDDSMHLYGDTEND